MQPATIKLFLTDGKPAGIRTAEISNWTGKAIAGPHSELTQLLQREELLSPGIYFLTGVDADTDKPTLYIGEAESVAKRLKQHDKREWNQAAAFVSKDENLTKAHIRYLEGALIILAGQSNTVQLLNSASSGAKLPESDQAEMDVYLEKVLQLLPLLSLGGAVDAFKVIESESSQPDAKQAESMLTCTIKGLIAKGKRSANGFVVFKGSQAVKEHRVASPRTKVKREQFVESALLAVNGDHLVFTHDYEFSSPSAAASIVRGGSSNGLTNWKNSDGVALKDLGEV
jgi:hypothetical protein